MSWVYSTNHKCCCAVLLSKKTERTAERDHGSRHRNCDRSDGGDCTEFATGIMAEIMTEFSTELVAEVATELTTKIVTKKNRIQTGRTAERDHGSSCRNYGGSYGRDCTEFVTGLVTEVTTELTTKIVTEKNRIQTGLKNGRPQSPVFVYFFRSFFNLAQASAVVSLLPNEVRRKYPSPFLPNPLPGVPTTCISFKR